MDLVIVLTVTALAFVSTPLLDRFLGRDAGWPLAAAFLGVAGFLSAGPGVAALDGTPTTWSTPWIPALDVHLALRLDALGLLFALFALVIGAVVFIYSTRYLGPGRQLSFYGLMTMFTVSMTGLVLADDLILLFACWELTSLASFLLIARAGRSGEAPGARTLLLTYIGGLTLLVAIALTIARTGTTNLTETLAADVWHTDPTFTAGIAALVAISGFTKSAQFPFHPWLPDAMAAATPVSAYLHAAAVVKAGIYLLLRFSPAFAHVPTWNALLIAAGLTTAVLGALFALQKSNLKKLMAYSTVSQLGWIVACIGVGTPLALTAAVLHTFAHALFKSGLFMFVGVVDHAAGTRDIHRLGPLWRSMPATFVCTTVGAAGMAGLPPLLGFVSKEGMLTALGEAPGAAWVVPVTLAVATVGAILTFAYCARIVLGGFIDGPRTDSELHHVSPVMIAAAAVPAVAGLPLAFTLGALDAPLAAIRDVVLGPAGSPPEPVHLALWHGFTVELGLTVLIVAAGIGMALARRPLSRRLEPDLFPVDGAELINRGIRGIGAFGELLGRPMRTDSPARHLALPPLALAGVALAALFASPALPAPHADLARPIDAVVLVLVVLAALGLVRARSRLAATVLLGGIGMAVTLQLFALGAPDVAMTQFLVEFLSVLVIMLVLRRLPARFHPPAAAHRMAGTPAAVVAIGTGLIAFLGVWTLTGRDTERSELTRIFLNHGPEITGGDNIVNTILVEFRALDTFGELVVLGFAGVGIAALLTSLPTRPYGHVPTGGRTAAQTLDARLNAMPLIGLTRVLVPLLLAVSAWLLWRGHNEPGGGFIAALVAGCAIGVVYMATPVERRVCPPGLPIRLISAGIVLATVTGLYGYLVTGAMPFQAAGGTFLRADAWHLLGVHLSSAFFFDLGVYLAVIGLVFIAFNELGYGDLPEGVGWLVPPDPHAGVPLAFPLAAAGAGSAATTADTASRTETTP